MRKDYLKPPSQQQRERIDHLVRLVEFARGDRKETPVSLSRLAATLMGTRRTRPQPDVGVDDVVSFKSWIAKGCDLLASGLVWEIDRNELGRFSITLSAKDTPPRIFHPESSIGLLRLMFLNLSAGEEWRIARCAWPPCARLFVKQGVSLYCKIQCSNSMRQLRRNDPARARQLEDESFVKLFGPFPEAARLLQYECPRKRSLDAHRLEKREHRLAPTGRVLCRVKSTAFEQYPFSRGQLQLREWAARELGADTAIDNPNLYSDVVLKHRGVSREQMDAIIQTALKGRQEK